MGDAGTPDWSGRAATGAVGASRIAHEPFRPVADLLIQRIFRLVDEIELTGGGTVLDRIYRAEKRGWAKAIDYQIRELRRFTRIRNRKNA